MISPRPRRCVALPAIGLALLLLPPAERGAHAGDAFVAAGLRDLHQGLYSRAEESFRAAAHASPGDPEPLLLVAFSHWWRIVLEDRGRADSGSQFDEAVRLTLAACEARLQQHPGDPGALSAAGSARVLLSHVEAMRRNYLRSAQEARRARRALEAAVERDPSAKDALFALGALNYYADRVPPLVKGLRALLFLPGGDATAGIAQLGEAARGSALFGTDARMLLAMIGASRDEGCYAPALDLLGRALSDNQGSPLILTAIAGVQTRLGRYDEAAGSLETALHGAAGDGVDRARQRRVLTLGLAETLAADWRLDAAARTFRGLDGDPAPWPAGLERRRARLVRELAVRRGAIPLAAWEDDPPAGGAPPEIDLTLLLRAQEEGRIDEAIRQASRILPARPGGALPRFLRGRLLFLSGRDAEARDDLHAALADAGEAPPWFEGWGALYLGLLHVRAGDSRAARAEFRRASDVRRFRSADRGLFEMAPQGKQNICPAFSMMIAPGPVDQRGTAASTRSM